MTLKIYLQIRDSAAVVEFASFLEEEVKSGRKKWTEISAEQKLNQVRRYSHCNTFIYIYRPHTKYGEGNVFTGVCLFTEGGSALEGRVCLRRRGVCLGREGGLHGGEVCMVCVETPSPIEIWSTGGCMHPTGMHSSFKTVHKTQRQFNFGLK